MTSRTFALVSVLAVSVVTLSVAAVSSSPATSAGAPSQTGGAPATQTDPLFLANDLPRLPAGVVRAVRPLSVMRATYEFAARHPEVMNYVPCFCGCERGGHKDNHDCFVSGRDAKKRVTSWEVHAVECEICVDVAYQAFQMHTFGSSVAAIRDAVEKKYASHRGGHTPTPLPPKRGGNPPH